MRSGDGYYTICGRRSDLIISSGFNVYPREVEEFLEQQEGVAERPPLLAYTILFGAKCRSLISSLGGNLILSG